LNPSELISLNPAAASQNSHSGSHLPPRFSAIDSLLQSDVFVYSGPHVPVPAFFCAVDFGGPTPAAPSCPAAPFFPGAPVFPVCPLNPGVPDFPVDPGVPDLPGSPGVEGLGFRA